MKLHYGPETDSLDIELAAAPSAETREITSDIDFDAAGAAVGIDIDHASQKLDLTTSETEAVPFRSIEAA